eukprot:gene6132-7639_t
MSQTKIISIILLAITIAVGADTNPLLTTPNFLGANDTGVSYFPEFEGLKMHVRCYINNNISTVNGSIAIFDSGLPFFSTAWGSFIPVFLPHMSAMNISKACFFDRYGYGWSDAAPYPFSSPETVRRLRSSLKLIAMPPPYIFVGWSWGNVDAQTYSVMFPSEIKGILSVDGSDVGILQDPLWITSMPYFQTEISNLITINNNGGLRQMAQNNGIPITFGYIPSTTNLPYNCINASQEIFLSPSNKYLVAIKQELDIMFPSAEILNETYSTQLERPLSNTPFVLITCTQNGQDWVNRQHKMSTLSSNSIVIENNVNSHMIVFEDPAYIVNALYTLVNLISVSPPVNNQCNNNPPPTN